MIDEGCGIYLNGHPIRGQAGGLHHRIKNETAAVPSITAKPNWNSLHTQVVFRFFGCISAESCKGQALNPAQRPKEVNRRCIKWCAGAEIFSGSITSVLKLDPVHERNKHLHLRALSTKCDLISIL